MVTDSKKYRLAMDIVKISVHNCTNTSDFMKVASKARKHVMDT